MSAIVKLEKIFEGLEISRFMRTCKALLKLTLLMASKVDSRPEFRASTISFGSSGNMRGT